MKKRCSMEKFYKSEEEFLKDYNAKDFDQLSMTADILLISVSSEEVNNYRKNSKKMMSILLVKRDDYPFKDKWCLPGGFLDPNRETLEECAKRVLKRETNLSNIYLEQLYTYDALDRDPRTRVVSTAFIALIDKKSIVIALCTEEKTKEKLFSNIEEILAREGSVILVTNFESSFESLKIPTFPSEFMPLIAIIPMQFLALHMCEKLGYNPDKPKNLAKSVTVE